MSEDFGSIVLNDLTSHGLRRVHIMRSGKRAEPSQWTNLIPVEAEDSYEHFCIRDNKVKDTWHLWMIWHVHEKVNLMFSAAEDGSRAVTKRLSPAKRLVGILWFIEKDELMGAEIDKAVQRYLVDFERWPEKILTAKLPKDAPNNLTWKDDSGSHVVKIEQAEGIPLRCVFVTRNPEPPDPRTVMGLGTPSRQESAQSEVNHGK